jgi:hypothetical protein
MQKIDTYIKEEFDTRKILEKNSSTVYDSLKINHKKP